ncbi:serine hydrolase domain-containing protein [Roseibium suaedae]|uniref:CubicO group peptidase, beta-lactamase class C family n=1 Tax=Roseibium suaedae TaxID=735517 RepID=A0A1M7LHR5_9HYPH|nr:serine hydrolase [Roseibium suaedae]SHM77160.1 CubicO group peptidase, beta-lactamase class C family [Roseibium suaedae]
MTRVLKVLLAPSLGGILAAALALNAAANAGENMRPLETSLQAAFDRGELKGLHEVLVIHKGEVLAESFFDGEDQNWGQPLGKRSFDAESLHDIRSVTKSIVSLLYGIALSEGKVPDLETPLVSLFPQYADLAKDEERQRIKVHHALSMQMGMEWDENLPYSDPRNSEIQMENAPDRYRFILDRPIVTPPGQGWTYSGGAVALIGKLIADGTGKSLDDYAAEKLFGPLGISRFEWARGPDGTLSAASGLRMTARDLARIGQMIANGGSFENRQIVPEDWLKASITPHADIDGGQIRYGYLWWLSGKGSPAILPAAWAAGFGNGGQRLTVYPGEDLVVIVLAGNYNLQDAWRVPVSVIVDHVAPAVFK